MALSSSTGPELGVSGLRKATWMGKGSGCCTRGLGADEWRAVPESWGLDESSEDSEDRDHAVPFSSSSCLRSMFWEKGEDVLGPPSSVPGRGKEWAGAVTHIEGLLPK